MIDMSYILDDDNNPVPAGDVVVAAVWCHQHPERIIVKQEEVHDVFVSTVFLHGINHNFWDDGPPVLWETMVFARRNGKRGDSIYQERYTSYADALAGHAKAVERARSENFNE